MSDAEETCGHTVVDADGIEEPCGLPVALGGWRYYEGHEHEDTLRRVCADHEQWALSNGIRARDAEVAEQARAQAYRDLWAHCYDDGDAAAIVGGFAFVTRELGNRAGHGGPDLDRYCDEMQRRDRSWEPEP